MLVSDADEVTLDDVLAGAVDEVTLTVVLAGAAKELVLVTAPEDVLLDIVDGTPVPLPPHAAKSSEVVSSPAGKILRNATRMENSFLSQQASSQLYAVTLSRYINKPNRYCQNFINGNASFKRLEKESR